LIEIDEMLRCILIVPANRFEKFGYDGHDVRRNEKDNPAKTSI